MTRRSTHIEHDVLYASVGASNSPDLLRFPPEGATPYVDELKIGSGSDRFLIAASTLMTWGAQRAAGMEVFDIHDSTGALYTGITFNADGTPTAPLAADVQYSADGEPYLTTGTTATLQGPDGRPARKVRVVYTVDDPRRIGFALGSAEETVVIGEHALFVEYREDDSVWATARGFIWATEEGLFGLKGKASLKLFIKHARLQIDALAPGMAAEPEAVSAEAEAEAMPTQLTDSSAISDQDQA